LMEGNWEVHKDITDRITLLQLQKQFIKWLEKWLWWGSISIKEGT
jgi:hypothetical protein